MDVVLFCDKLSALCPGPFWPLTPFVKSILQTAADLIHGKGCVNINLQCSRYSVAHGCSMSSCLVLASGVR